VERPHVYGNEVRCRAALKRYIESGDELLDQAVGVRKRMDAVEADERLDGSFAAFEIEQYWTSQVRRWFSAARAGLGKFFQDQMEELMPVLTLGLMPDTGKPRHWTGLENGVPWLKKALEEVRQVQDAIGVRRDVAKTAPLPARFEELHASGLVAENLVNDRAKEMASPRTPRQLAIAIGSAKELTEATLRAALDRLGEPYAPSDAMPTLMKKWRKAVEALAPPDPHGAASLDKAQAALASLVTFLAEWRNAYGSGHGRPEYPPGLRASHARLATDAAETSVRFIVTTMDDLSRLPP
jgi:hypothetical protein